MAARYLGAALYRLRIDSIAMPENPFSRPSEDLFVDIQVTAVITATASNTDAKIARAFRTFSGIAIPRYGKQKAPT